MSTETNNVKTEQELEVNAEKRAFMKKFGKYAVVGVGMSTLMSPTASASGNYNGMQTKCSGAGWSGPRAT